MITLKDSIEIRTTPDKIFNWFKTLDKNFTKWHPNHKKFIKVTGGLDEGDIVYFEECVDGKWFKVKCKITNIEKKDRSWRTDFESVHWLGRLIGTRISFIVKAKGDICIFTHIESFGFRANIISNLTLKLLKSWFPLIKKDIEEDNLNLKKILEMDSKKLS
jgi:hypothetical protein